MTQNFGNKRILLIISGGIAAYKSLELIRLLRGAGHGVRCILTSGGARFITPLSVSSLSGEHTYTDLWSLKDETEMGHIRLSREADLIVVAPASANMIAKMAHGLADDLAATTILASDKPVMIAPAMNQEMWSHAATQANIETLKKRGILQIGPASGDMACGETGMGRMAEAEDIFDAIQRFFFERPLKGLSSLVTSGPTFESIDPVRFIGNRSSGKQGIAVAKALSDAGAKVTLVTGPVSADILSALSICHPREGRGPAKQKPDARLRGHDNNGYIELIRVSTAEEMLAACEKNLPADIAVCAAAVSDWRPEKTADRKIKKSGAAPAITLTENPDILKTIAAHKKRPALVIGFAAETEKLLQNAKEKLARKKCDWILANDVSGDTFGADDNHVWLVTKTGAEEWPKQAKDALARRLVKNIADHFERTAARDAAG